MTHFEHYPHEHYPQRTVTLHLGDEIRATYRQRPNAPVRIVPATLKRLSGWTEGMRYKGVVRHVRKGEILADYSFVVDFFDEKTGKHQCTHIAYNVEAFIAKGELYDITYTPNPSPSLFPDY